MDDVEAAVFVVDLVGTSGAGPLVAVSARSEACASEVIVTGVATMVDGGECGRGGERERGVRWTLESGGDERDDEVEAGSRFKT